jgi:hypothetical protein
MKLINLGKRTCVGVITVLVLIASSRFADASVSNRAINGNSAIPAPISAASCMWIYYGAVYNFCSSSINVIIPLSVDQPGARTFTVTANAPSTASPVGCRVYSTNWDISTVSQSSFSYVTSFGSSQPISLAVPAVSHDGQTWVNCSIGPNAFVNVVNYKP